MPYDQSKPCNDTASRKKDPSVENLSNVFPHLSLKAGLAVFLSVGLFLFLLGRFNSLLAHTLVEFATVILLSAVFMIGWKTRNLVRSQFLVVLAVGLFAAGLVDLLHTLAYEGLQLLPAAGPDTAAQFWLAARLLGAVAFLCAAFSLGHQDFCNTRQWLLGFLSAGVLLSASIWPLGIFPSCITETGGPTSFQVTCIYLVIFLLCLAGGLLWSRSRRLSRHITLLLLLSIVMRILSELVLTVSVHGHDFMDFIGHYFNLVAAMLVYSGIVEGALNAPFSTYSRDISQSYDELNRELQRRVAAEEQQKAAHHEATLLYRMSRAMHSVLNLDELSHLMLSAATGVNAGGFERAMLFTVNRRTGMLQGMLGVCRERSPLVLPVGEDPQVWELLHLDEHALEAQRKTPFNQKVVKQRLPLDKEDNALARAFLDKNVVLVPRPEKEPSGGRQLAEALGLGPYACVPLSGRDQIMGILLVDNPTSKREISSSSRRFLGLFASQAGSALDNASLVKRLEMAHDNLQDVQEQLIHGEKMAVLGEMAAQVAHELRNPLVSVGGFARRLARQNLKDPKAKEYAEIIAREVQRMEELLGNILAFSKKQLVCLDICRVGEILQEIFDLEFEDCRSQGVELVVDLPEVLPELVGDCRQLRQVFLNLMINARQAMSSGGTLTVRARPGSLRGERAMVVEVEDTGGGISPDVMRNIFNPFFSTVAGGTGLGLSISHRIIEHHHGAIEVINGERGARFIVTLPLHQPGPQNVEREG